MHQRVVVAVVELCFWKDIGPVREQQDRKASNKASELCKGIATLRDQQEKTCTSGRATKRRQKFCSRKRPPKLEPRSVRPNEVFENLACRICPE